MIKQLVFVEDISPLLAELSTICILVLFRNIPWQTRSNPISHARNMKQGKQVKSKINSMKW
jgi:hypothetical protein